MARAPTVSPSAWAIEQAMMAAQSFSARLRALEPNTDNDDMLLALDSETDVFDVLRKVVRASMEAEAFELALTGRIAAMQIRKSRYGNRSDAARGLAFAMLDAMGLSSFDDPEFHLSVRAGTAAVQITDDAAIPARFVKTTTSPDKAAIKAAIAAGEDVPGAVLSNSMPTLSVRKA